MFSECASVSVKHPIEMDALQDLCTFVAEVSSGEEFEKRVFSIKGNALANLRCGSLWEGDVRRSIQASVTTFFDKQLTSFMSRKAFHAMVLAFLSLVNSTAGSATTLLTDVLPPRTTGRKDFTSNNEASFADASQRLAAISKVASGMDPNIACASIMKNLTMPWSNTSSILGLLPAVGKVLIDLWSLDNVSADFENKRKKGKDALAAVLAGYGEASQDLHGSIGELEMKIASWKAIHGKKAEKKKAEIAEEEKEANADEANARFCDIASKLEGHMQVFRRATEEIMHPRLEECLRNQ